MKRFSIFIYILFAALTACQKDETMVIISSDAKPAKITSPSTGFDVVVTAINIVDTVSFAWDKADYGVATEVVYTIEVDSKCGDFSSPVTVGSSTSVGSFSITIDDFNSKLVDRLHLAPFQKSDIQIRVISTINNKQLTISDPIQVSVTPYSDKPVALWFGENSATAPVVYATGSNTYESYRYVKAGSYRFTNNPVCADVVYGSPEGGILVESNSAGKITVDKDGYYKINVDTEALTYQLTLIDSWGAVGSGTPGSWDNSTALTYNATKDIWEETMNLVGGALKFRANNSWTLNYGPTDSNSLNGQLKFDDQGAVSIPKDGVYKVTADFSQSKSPYVYTYTILYLGDFPPPSRLWVPGGYEGFDPSKAPFLSSITPGGAQYEGYINISSSTGIKFTNAPDYGHINYGAGATAGTLSTSGADIDWSTPGYYKFNVDTDKLTYTATLITTWGLIGTATAGNWDTSTPMNYDAVGNVWTVTADLKAGALKFRANNGWDINYGPAQDILAGALTSTDNAISIKADGNYTVTVDFTKKDIPFAYSYSVVLNK